MKYIFSLLIMLSFTSCKEIESSSKLESAAGKFQEGNAEEAKAELLEYFKIDPSNKENTTALTILGHIYSSLDETKKAEKAYEKVLRLEPDRVEALTGLGILARKQQDYEKAAEYYERAIELEPDYAQAVSSLSVIYLLDRDFEKAVSMGEQALRLDEEDPAIAANLAIAAYYNQDSIKQEKYYNIAKELGYNSLEDLDLILSGETTLFPED